MEDNLDNLEPPRKRFKRADQRPISTFEDPCVLLNIPQDILSELLDYLDTKTIYNLTITCHYFKKTNLWSLVTKLDPSARAILPVINSVDVNKLTKLENFDIDRADDKGYLSALHRLTNVRSLNMKGGHLRTSLVANLLPRFPLIRELTTPLDPDVLANYPGAFLTKLALRPTSFDARYIKHFSKLEVLYLRSIQEMTNTDALTHLACLTALIMTGRGVKKSDLKLACCLTQLKYLETIAIGGPKITSLSNLSNLTCLKCDFSLSKNDWTKTLAPMTALQRIDVFTLDVRSFTPHHCSTLTHLAYYKDSNQSPVFDLTALQCLTINISPDPAMHSRFSELQRLTSLTLRLNRRENKVNTMFWTALTHLSHLELPRETDERLVNATKRLMPSVNVDWRGPYQKFI